MVVTSRTICLVESRERDKFKMFSSLRVVEELMTPAFQKKLRSHLRSFYILRF